MAHYRIVVAESAATEDFPLEKVGVTIDVEAQFADIDMPEAARRRMAADALRRLVRDLDGSDLDGNPGATPSEDRRMETSARPQRPTVTFAPDDDWVRPAGIDMRIVKSAHRVIQEVAKRGETGQAVLASELVQDGLVSAPTMSRLLRDDETAGQYIDPFVVVSTAGRTKALDLTPKGRLLASKIRAGVVPS